MSLTPCPECHEQISAAARACPKCGHPLFHIDRAKRIGVLVAVALSAASVVGLLVIRALKHS
jgi:uncharacterized paraquat-inducible protein A